MNKIDIYKRIATPSSGDVSWNTPHLHGDIVSIHIKPTTATTSYSFKIVGVNGMLIFQTGMQHIGELSQSFNADSCNEIMTCTIFDSSADEAFTIELRIKLYENSR